MLFIELCQTMRGDWRLGTDRSELVQPTGQLQKPDVCACVIAQWLTAAILAPLLRYISHSSSSDCGDNARKNASPSLTSILANDVVES